MYGVFIYKSFNEGESLSPDENIIFKQELFIGITGQGQFLEL